MPTNSPKADGLPLEWSSILDKVEQALSQAQADMQRREQAYAAKTEPQSSSNHWEEGWRVGMQRLEERTAAMQQHLHEQEEQANTVEAELGAGEDELRQWVGAIQEIQRSLAKGAGAEV